MSKPQGKVNELNGDILLTDCDVSVSVIGCSGVKFVFTQPLQ